VSDGLLNGLIETSAFLVSASVRTALLFPAAWLLERIVHRLRSDPDRFGALALRIAVVTLYAIGTAEVLSGWGYMQKEHPLIKTLGITTGVVMLATVPLLLLWGVVAFRQRHR
jgi:hypothetical protein